MSILCAVQDYTAIRRWCGVPIPFKSKKPVIDEWQNLRIAYHDLPRYFRGRCNLGVLLGEPSAWLIDVDLDHGLAVELAPEFLPATDAIFGRASKMRSHWLYTITAPAATKKEQAIVNGERAMLVEFRSTGCQTVFPPSIHTSGERIEWARDGEPAKFAPDVLLLAVSKLAAEVRKRLGVQDVAAEFKPRKVPVGPMRTATSSDVERCRRYVAKIPTAVTGQRGDPTTFHVCCILARFGLTGSDAWGVISEFNQRCDPQWHEQALRRNLENALAAVSAAGQFGEKLRRQTDAWRLQKPGEPVAIWHARVHAIEHRIKEERHLADRGIRLTQKPGEPFSIFQARKAAVLRKVRKQRRTKA